MQIGHCTMKIMMNFSVSLAFVVIIYLHSWMQSYAATVCPSAIYSFGDSLADTGNWLASNPIAPIIVGKLPYGETYFKRATGRFSDGRLVVDHIAQASGLPFLPPYLGGDPFAVVGATIYTSGVNSIYTSGVNFAVAGATALEPSFFVERLIMPPLTLFSLDTQIQWFLDYRKQFCSNSTGCEEHFANALFMVGEIGGNDYNNPFIQGVPMEEVENFIPIGCSALLLTKYANGLEKEPLDGMGCMPRFNAFAQRGNDLLQARVAELQVQYPDVKFVFADNYNAALNILQSPQMFGLVRETVLDACCGAGGPYNYNPLMPCGLGLAVSCANPIQSVNWDGIHLTDAAYGEIATLFLDGSYTTPPFHTLCGA